VQEELELLIQVVEEAEVDHQRQEVLADQE
jgi:hypothetical protein